MLIIGLILIFMANHGKQLLSRAKINHFILFSNGFSLTLHETN